MKLKFEIINPSDKCFIEGDNFKTVCVATAIVGAGQYGLEEIDGDLSMPVLIFATGWFEDEFKQNIESAMAEVPKIDIAEVLDTVKLKGEQTSMNDIVGLAKRYVQAIRNEEEVK